MNRQKTIAPNPDIWARIETKQAELQALYEEASEGIYKSTDGEAYLGDKNVFYAQHWLGAVKKTPKAMPGEFDIADFEVKTGLFPNVVAAYNGHNALGAILDTPYTVLSKDVFRYSSDVKKMFDSSSDPVRKQTVKDAPLYRKPTSAKKEGDNNADKASDDAPK